MDKGLIINNLLVCMITESMEGFITNEEYYSWLINEIGLDIEDIDSLKKEGYLPLPYSEEEVVSLINNKKGE